MRTNTTVSEETTRVDEATEQEPPAALPPREAPLYGEPGGSDRGPSLLPVVAPTMPAGDRSADEQSPSSRLRLWPPSRRLAAVAVLAVGAAAAMVWVAGRGVERQGAHAAQLEASPATPDVPLRVEAMARPQHPADEPAESRSQPPSAEPLEADEPVAERATEQVHRVAAERSPSESPATGAGHADAAEQGAPDGEPTAGALQPFDRAAARSALNGAAIAASGCKQGGVTDPTGTVVSVTFAPTGRVTKAVVSGGPFAGTATGSCIIGAFRGLSVPAFSGGAITAQITVTLR